MLEIVKNILLNTVSHRSNLYVEHTIITKESKVISLIANTHTPGSKWWKIDFHTHTPKSKNDYGHGDESLKSILPINWLQAAMNAGLNGVVVTDHNTGEWIDDLKAAYETLYTDENKPDWFSELVIFPGVEITVADSSKRIHLLAIFDPSCNSHNISSVLGACGIYSGFGDDRNTSTTKGFCDTAQAIKRAGGIVIAAHVDGPKGLLENVTTINEELKKSLEQITAAEYCNLHKFDTADPQLIKELNKIAKVSGSDAHKPDEIGRSYTWAKMSCPSLTGLRLALLEHVYCVKNQRNDPNTLPDIYIKQLTITSMQHCGRIPGRPFIMQFHPHFNAVIGGRGSGKSTALESIRIASRRDKLLTIEAERLKKDLDEFMKLAQDKGVMRNDTELSLEIMRRGILYRIHWRYDGQGVILETYTAEGWKETETGDLLSRFPLSIFSQKQIYELADSRRGLLAIIDRAPDVKKDEWEMKWKEQKSRYLQLCERYRNLSAQIFNEVSIKARLKDVENDLRLYEEKGHGVILKSYQKRSQQQNSLNLDYLFDNLATAVCNLASSVELPDFPGHLFDADDSTFPELKSIHDTALHGMQTVRKDIELLADHIEGIKNERLRQLTNSAWNRAVQEAIDAYHTLESEYAGKANPLSLNAYGEWVQLRSQLLQQLKSLEAIKKEAQDVQKQIDEAYQNLFSLRRQLYESREAFLQKTIGDNPYVRMGLVPFGDVGMLEEEYRNLLNLGSGFGSSILDKESKQGVLYDLSVWEYNRIPTSDLPRMIKNFKQSTFNIASGKESGYAAPLINRLRKLMETQPAAFDQMWTYWPEDLLQVRYTKDPAEDRFDDLEKGSKGQKAAAILAFLLSYGDEPLIMDQPEDDLDNALVSELIVRQIHENKNRRQLIIVTHNPNLVVNGDAELVHVMKFFGGQVQLDQQGGLEEESIRKAICDIMEGGPDAFKKRYQRIVLEENYV